MEYLLCFLISYAFGCINPAYIIGLLNGINIKQSGTKNAGASNTFILLGMKAGVTVFLVDLLKTVLAITICNKLFSFDEVLAVSALGVICGHIFPVYLKFNGGKGTACMIAMAATILPFKVFLPYAIIVLILVLTINYIIVCPVTVSLTFPFVYYFVYSDLIGSLLLSIVFIITIIKHTENFINIKNKTEKRFSYLWTKKKVDAQ